MSDAIQESTTVVASNEPIDLSTFESKGSKEQAVWDRLAANRDPISKEDVVGEPPKEEAPAAPDRELVAPKLAELIKAAQQVPEEAPPAEPEPTEDLDKLDLVLKKLEKFEENELTAQQAQEQADTEAKYLAIRDGIIANVEADKDAYPGLFALEQQETLVHLLASQQEEGKEVSEFDVASEIESKCRSTWEKLNAIYGATESNVTEKSNAEPTPTLTSTLVSTDDPLDISEMRPDDAKAALWEQIKNR